ncbi:MAG: PaaI family thioesterase [Victivallales bacterium]|nr:PaaI family thioesterase [Victivallales bacterium]
MDEKNGVAPTPRPKHPHPHCLLCGDRNPWSLQLRFTAAADGEVSTWFKGRQALQGYSGFLHGGVIASLLDSAMTNCLFQQGIRAVTGELKIRYRHPIPCRAELDLRARVTAAKPPLFQLEAELRQETRVMARATAKFMQKEEL